MGRKVETLLAHVEVTRRYERFLVLVCVRVCMLSLVYILCVPADQCASGLNTTVPCPATGTAQDSNTANCPDLAVNATCNILITSGKKSPKPL